MKTLFQRGMRVVVPLITTLLFSCNKADLILKAVEASGFTTMFATNGFDQFNALKTTIDGGYIAVGYCARKDSNNITGNENSDMLLVKIAPSGEIEKQITLGGSGNDMLNTVVVGKNGHIYAGGSTESTDGNFQLTNALGSLDFILLEFDASLNLQKLNRFGGSGFDEIKTSTISDAGLLFVGGNTSSTDGSLSFLAKKGRKDVWVATISLSDLTVGNQARYGGKGDQEIKCLISSNNYLYVGGYADGTGGEDIKTPTYGAFDAWIVQLNTNELTIKNQFLFGGDGYDEVNSMVLNRSGDLCVCGYTTSDKTNNIPSSSKGWKDAWLVKLNINTGLVVKNFVRLGGVRCEGFNSIALDDIGNICVLGETDSEDNDLSELTPHGKTDIWALKFNMDFKCLNKKRMGGTGYDCVNDAVVNKDGSIIIAGYTNSEDGDLKKLNEGEYDAYIMKFVL